MKDMESVEQIILKIIMMVISGKEAQEVGQVIRMMIGSQIDMLLF
jgi:hypothetical protein